MMTRPRHPLMAILICALTSCSHPMAVHPDAAVEAGAMPDAAEASGRDNALSADLPTGDAPIAAGTDHADGPGSSAGAGGTIAGTGGSSGRGGATTTGGIGGTGGAGGTGTILCGGGIDNCGLQTRSTTRLPSDVLLVLDRSTSMYYAITEDCFCSDADAAVTGSTTYTLCTDTSNCQSRWSAVEPALVDLVSRTSGVNWGLELFSTPGAAQCSVSNDVEVPVGPATADPVKGQLESATTSLGTPTALALKVGVDYLKTLNDSHSKSILLVTDGEPNCGGTPASMNIVDLTGASNAAKAAFAAGFPVYVVGIGPNLGNLTELARQGGTGDYYPASSPLQLVDALATIGQLVALCTVVLANVPPDPSNIAVYLDKTLVEKDAANGWSFGDNSQTIVLSGSTCEKLTSGAASTVQVLFGCPGSPYPPCLP